MGEVAQISSGGTPDRSEASYWGGDIPWVTTGEIQFNTITDTTEKITVAGLKNSSAKLFPAGTLLMAMYGQGKTRGQVAKLGIEAATNQNSAAILLHKDQDPDFYFHFLSSRYEDIREFGNSGGVSHLNAGLLRRIEVPCAPYAEQRKMAETLTAWDDAVATTEKLLANSRGQAHALLSKVLMPVPKLDRKRVSGDGHPPSVQSGVPQLPSTRKAWRKTTLGEHLREVVRPAILEADQPYRLVTVRRSRGGVDERGTLLGSEIKTPTQFHVRAGDFLISKRQIVHGACGFRRSWTAPSSPTSTPC